MKKEDPRTFGDKHYVTGIPRKPLPAGRVLVHNHVLPQPRLGWNGFRAWTQTLDDTLMVCPCKWAGVDLRGLTHYRSALANPWRWEDEAEAEKARVEMSRRLK
jgi:hypothetical protein